VKYLISFEGGKVVRVGLEIGHLLSGVFEVCPCVKSSEFVELLSLEIGLLAQKTDLFVDLLEAAEHESWRAKQCLHHF
jgi:hypothetical protein